MTFDIHTVETASEEAKPVLFEVKKAYGRIPNLYGVFAESPAALKAYLTLNNIFEQSSSFNAIERQVVLMTASFENDCRYCMAAQSVVARMQGVPPSVVKALRDEEFLGEERLEALRTFTREIVQRSGWVAGESLNGFLAAGFSKRQVLEVILGVSLKTLSNYTNHIAETPIDKAFERQAWERPTQRQPTTT